MGGVMRGLALKEDKNLCCAVKRVSNLLELLTYFEQYWT